MTTSFPTGLDAFTNFIANEVLGSHHLTHHSDMPDAVEALQAKVGIDGSAVITSLDYRINHILGYYYPSNYGSVGGVDDRTAVQAAIDAANAAGGGTVLINILHNIKSTINPKSNVRILATSKFAGFKAMSSFTGNDLIGGGGTTNWFTVEGCMLDGNSLVQKVVNVGSGGSAAGHNYIRDNQCKGATTVAIDAGYTIGGSETHVIHNNITSSPSGIFSGQDNHIFLNNMGSITSVGIQLVGGCTTVSNHVVTNGASANCVKVLRGQVHIIIGNYFDASGTQSAPMLIVQPPAGDTAVGGQIIGNQFYAQWLSTDVTYPAMSFDQATGATGSIDNWQIIGNQGRARTSFMFSAIATVSGTATNIEMDRNRLMYCNSIGNLNASSMGTNAIYDGSVWKIGRRRQPHTDLTYSTSMTPDAMFGDRVVINATNGTGFTINNPTNPLDGMKLPLTIKNSSGTTLGAITWGSAYLFYGAVASPVNGAEKTIWFEYSNSDSKWHQIAVTESTGGGGTIGGAPPNVTLGDTTSAAGATGNYSDAGHTHGVDSISTVVGLSIPSPVTGTYFCGVVQAAMTLVSIGAYRDGGTGLTVNFGRGSKASPSKGKAADVSATSSDTVITGAADQNLAYSPGDQMYVVIQTVSGSPTLAAVQANFTVP